MSAWRARSWWDGAATLDERVRLLRGRLADVHAPGEADAERCWRRWREALPVSTDEAWRRRLAAEGLDEAELRACVVAPPAPARGEAAPRWAAAVEASFTAGGADASSGEPAAAFAPASGASSGEPAAAFAPADANAATFHAFASAFAPLASEARARVLRLLRRTAGDHEDLLEPDALAAQLWAAFQPHLVALVGPTLTLELNVFGLAHREQHPGADAHARYRAFLAALARGPAARALLEEYPVLARRLVAALDDWATHAIELVSRLAADLPALERTGLLTRAHGGVVRLELGLSDRHRGGRSVAILAFASGERVVYKPRSLAVEARFQALLAWLNQRGVRPALRVLGVLDRGTHGWMEHVGARPAADAAAVERFFARQGAYLAILYALGGVDVHAENVIACGEHPVLVDLECLFHARAEPGGPDAPATSPDPRTDVRALLADSVLSTALLPRTIWAAGDHEGVDVSGLGQAHGQLTPYKLRFWEGQATDELRIVKRQVPIDSQQHRATLAGAAVDAGAHLASLRAGFARTHALLRRERDALLAPGGPLAAFAGAKVRFLARGTLSYARLVEESHHPDLLRDALEQARLFEHLWQGTADAPGRARLVAHERRDLERCDVPFFTTRADATALWTSDGTCLLDFFPASGLELARRRLARLDEVDLERQLWIIDASFASMKRPTFASGGGVAPAPEAPPTELATAFLAAARCIGDRLAALAIESTGADGESAAEWLALPPNGRSFAIAPAGLDLYGGLPGIALYLAYLGDVAGDARYTRLARRALVALHGWRARAGHLVRQIGLYEGWGGLAYAYAHLARLWPEPDEADLWRERADDAARRIAEHVDADLDHDVIAGAAGAVFALLALGGHEPLLARLGHRLVAAPAPAQTGFAHGAAGRGAALAALAARLSRPAYARAADVSLARACAELRAPSAAAAPAAWCHGAAGIGFALLRTGGDPDELARAARATAARGFGDGHCLCHGELGSIELLVTAAGVLGDDALAIRARRAAAALAARTGASEPAAAPLSCGTPGRLEVPGLMTGLAGIGWGFLRLAAPARVPSILALEPPAAVTALASSSAKDQAARSTRSNSARFSPPAASVSAIESGASKNGSLALNGSPSK